MLNERQKAEVSFWKRDFEKYKPEEYATVRAGNLDRIRKRWPEIDELEGIGLDLGCGPCSVFEGWTTTNWRGVKAPWVPQLHAIDPLLDEYDNFYIPPGQKGEGVVYRTMLKEDTIPYANGFFDFIFCINVIDHTEHWEKLIQEMRRVLKVHGFLFLQVNFDWELTEPEHVKLWNWETVQKEISSHFYPVRQTVEWDYDYERESYWGKFTKQC